MTAINTNSGCYFSDFHSRLRDSDSDSIAESADSDMSPGNHSVVSSSASESSLSSLDEPFVLKTPKHPPKLLSLINGHNSSASNTSTDSLSTFVLSENEAAKAEPPGMKKLKSSLKLNTMRKSLQRSSSMPILTKKSVKFPSNGLEDVVFFKKHDTPLSVSAIPSSEEEEEEEEEELDWNDFNTHTVESRQLSMYLNSIVKEPKREEWKILSTNVDVLVSSKSFFKASDRNIVYVGSNLYLNRVCLKKNTLFGNVLVRNLAFDKKIEVKYSVNGWKSWRIAQGYFIESLDSNIDKFQFKINVDQLSAKDDFELSFCIMYGVNGQEYWDNNDGKNFKMDLLREVDEDTDDFEDSNGYNNYNYSSTINERPKTQSQASDFSSISKSNISMLNEILENNRHRRKFPEDSIDVWFKKGPSNNFNGRYSFESISEGNSPIYSVSDFSLVGKSYDEVVERYCFYQGDGEGFKEEEKKKI